MNEYIKTANKQLPTKEQLRLRHKAIAKAHIRRLDEQEIVGFNPVDGLLDALDSDHIANLGIDIKVRYHGYITDAKSHDDMLSELYSRIIKYSGIQSNIEVNFIHKVKPIGDKVVIVTKGYTINYVDNSGNDIRKEICVTHLHFIDSKRLVLFGVTFKDVEITKNGETRNIADTFINKEVYNLITKYCTHIKAWRVVHDIFYRYNTGEHIRVLKVADNTKWYQIISKRIVENYGMLFMFNCFEFGGVSKSLFGD